MQFNIKFEDRNYILSSLICFRLLPVYEVKTAAEVPVVFWSWFCQLTYHIQPLQFTYAFSKPVNCDFMYLINLDMNL